MMRQSSRRPLVSIIVPTRNSARFLDQCLGSLFRQSYEPIEILVVDNHSTDATLEIARRYTANVYTLGPERSAQFNMGAARASGEYVYKVDSDFVLEREVVAACVTEIDKGFDAIVVHNSPDTSVGWLARIRKFEVDMYKYDLTHSSARFVDRHVFLALGGFNEAITAGEDYDFQNRLNRAGYRTGFIEPEAIHLGEPTSFWQHMYKYFNYGRDFVTYTRANPKESKYQLKFLRSVYWRHRRQFIRHPLRGTAFVIYNCFKYLFGGLGLVVGRMGAGERPVESL
jgi:glycosyltransferase involved in cell wall biosynthesis